MYFLGDLYEEQRNSLINKYFLALNIPVGPDAIMLWFPVGQEFFINPSKAK